VTVFHVGSNYQLWYFNGEDPTAYHIQVTYTANGATTGTFKWEVIAGTTKVNLENDTDIITLTDDNQVGVKSTYMSYPKDDVTIQFTYNAVVVVNVVESVYVPNHAYTIDGPDDSDNGNGFNTWYRMEVEDQFGVNIPDWLSVNEEFSDWQSDYEGEDWSPLAAEWWQTVTFWDEADQEYGERFDDNYGCTGTSVDPDPVNPDDEDADTEIFHVHQTYCGGSLNSGDGWPMRWITKLQFYRG